MTGVPEIRSGARTAGLEGYEAGIMFGHDMRADCAAVSARLFGSYARALGSRPGKPGGAENDPTFRLRAAAG